MNNEKIKKKIKIVLYLLPAIIPLLIFWVLPMLASLCISFTDWDYMSPDYNIVGFENYADLLKNAEFYKAFFNTFYFSAGVVVPTIFLGLMVALLLKEKLCGSGFYKAFIFSPWITPTVAVSIVWSWFFEPENGLVNHLFELLRLQPLEWAHSSKWAMLVVIIVTVWKGLGWTMIFYLRALERVPKTLYEAAKVDGASSFRQFWNVTLPLISPTTFFLIVVNMINSIQAYDQIQILTQGGPAGSTRTLLYLYYQRAFENFDIGGATAISIIILMITMLLSIINLIMAKKWVYY
ncbi:MAG: sugar ABC transporter permease [Psychrilyobacter sp.]|uniref:carbohydrate ABC transporter permease n=1 Tax=Psychrilyobacter sp. TaxID=2586924 RepID=UPI003C77A41D